MKKVIVLMMSLIMILAMTSCGNEPASKPAEDLAEITAVLSIDFPDESGIAEVEDVSVTVPGGSTVYDVLKTYADANNIEILLEESGGIDCVTNIGGVVQTSSTGWTFEVNDEPIMETATECVVNNGDVIEWEVMEW